MNVLVLGATGMIGSAIYLGLREEPSLTVRGTIRSCRDKRFFDKKNHTSLISNVLVENIESVAKILAEVRPQLIVNCVGITKHRSDGKVLTKVISINSLFPHRLAELCSYSATRLIHISTDCIFSGQRGNYSELDNADATDVYGRTKFLGEIVGENILTIRTSTIGHEFKSKFGLLEWFLAQSSCNGFSRAIFSGLPATELARVLRDIVIPDASLQGVYHVGSTSIDKLSLLKLIAKVYKKDIIIDSDENLIIDRSLNVDKFAKATGYRAPAWPNLIGVMYEDYLFRK